MVGSGREDERERKERNARQQAVKNRHEHGSAPTISLKSCNKTRGCCGCKHSLIMSNNSYIVRGRCASLQCDALLTDVQVEEAKTGRALVRAEITTC